MSKDKYSSSEMELNREELKEIMGGRDTCDCTWFNGILQDYYDSTCECSGMGNVFGLMVTM